MEARYLEVEAAFRYVIQSANEHNDIQMSIRIGVGFTRECYVTIEALFAVVDAAIYGAKVNRGSVVEREVQASSRT